MLDFETALQSSTKLAALAGGNRLSPGVSVPHPPPPPLLLWRKSPRRRRVRRAAPACQWQPRILEEVGSCPEYFSYGAPPLEPAAAVFSCCQSGDGGVGAAVKNERGAFSSLGWRRGRRRRPLFHLLQFPNQTHPRQAREERPKVETRGARLVSPPPSRGCRRRARSGEQRSRFWARPPPRGTGDSGPGTRGEAARPRRSVPSSAAGRCGGGAEERRGGRGTGRAAGGGGRTSCTFPPRLAHSDSAEVRRAGAGNKGAVWGGERVGRGGAPGRLPEDSGRRKPKCHLNSTQGAGAWDPSALFSNNGWSASYKLRESRPGRRTITRPLRPRS